MSGALLGGKVQVVALERRFLDERGEVAIVHAHGRPADFIEYLEFRSAGDVRGGHYHRAYTELLYVIDGTLDAQFLDTGARRAEAANATLAAGSLVTIAPWVAHRFTALEPARALAFGHGSSPLEDRVSVDASAWAPAEAPGPA